MSVRICGASIETVFIGFCLLIWRAGHLLLSCRLARKPQTFRRFGQFLTFTQNLFGDYRVNQAFSHAWSLALRRHFYLFLPMVVASHDGQTIYSKDRGSSSAVLCCLESAFEPSFLFHVLRSLASSGQSFGFVLPRTNLLPHVQPLLMDCSQVSRLLW